MSKYTPDQGDLVTMDFDPQAGVEINKRRPALVMSKKEFNERMLLAYVAPITGSKRNNPFQPPLPAGLNCEGHVLLDQIRSLDYNARRIQYIGKVGEEFFCECLDLFEPIFWDV